MEGIDGMLSVKQFADEISLLSACFIFVWFFFSIYKGLKDKLYQQFIEKSGPCPPPDK